MMAIFIPEYVQTHIIAHSFVHLFSPQSRVDKSATLDIQNTHINNQTISKIDTGEIYKARIQTLSFDVFPAVPSAMVLMK